MRKFSRAVTVVHKSAWWWLAMALGAVLAAQDSTVRDAGRTCVVAVDSDGKEFSDFEVNAVELRYGNVVRTIKGQRCFTGRSGDVLAVNVYSQGHYRANFVLELDTKERVRVVQLRPGLFETGGSAIAGEVDCGKAHCTVRAMQLDGEHVYTADVSRGAFRIPSVRPGGYAVALQREGKAVCAQVVTVTEFTPREYGVDFRDCR